LTVYLVTGGCGFIGSHLVDDLVDRGHTVRILDDLSTGRVEQANPAATLIVGSVTDAHKVREAMEEVDGCFHLAAVASVPKCNRELATSHRVNIGGFVNLLQAARVYGRRPPIVYASSAAVYGVTRGVSLESSPPSPISHYGCDKLACEHHSRAAVESCGISSIGLRFFNVYGPRQDPSSPYSGVISIFVRGASEGHPIRIFGDGQQTRDFVYVADVVTAQRLAMAQLHQRTGTGSPAASVYNVCTGVPTTIQGLAEMVFAAVGGRQPEITYARQRDGDIRVSLGATETAAAEIGFWAKTPLPSGIRLTLGRQSGKQQLPTRSRISVNNWDQSWPPA
jgi:UDP-glucose 4-epimerase